MRTLLAAPAPAGAHEVRWNGRDEEGRVAVSGVYFLRLETADGSREERVLRLH